MTDDHTASRGAATPGDPMNDDDLTEEGRRLASERDDLIAAGVDPAALAVPVAPLASPATAAPAEVASGAAEAMDALAWLTRVHDADVSARRLAIVRRYIAALTQPASGAEDVALAEDEVEVVRRSAAEETAFSGLLACDELRAALAADPTPDTPQPTAALWPTTHQAFIADQYPGRDGGGA